MYSRRSLIKRMIQCCAMGTLMYPGLNIVLAREAKQVRKFELFMDLSRHVTGFDDLNSELGKHYYQDLINHSDPGTLSELLTVYSENKDLTPAMLMLKTDQPLVQSVIQLWYSGWLTPVDHTPDHIKAMAYTESLAWKAMGLVPRGVPKGQLWQAIAQQTLT